MRSPMLGSLVAISAQRPRCTHQSAREHACVLRLGTRVAMSALRSLQRQGSGMTTSSGWQGPRPGRIDLKEEGLSQKDACLAVCDDAEIWRSPDGETFATVTVTAEDGIHREHHPVYGRTFKDWLLSRVVATYYQSGRPVIVNENALRDVRGSLDARAYAEGIVNEAPLRVAEADGCIYIDTGWPNWAAFAVTPDGWDITASACSDRPLPPHRRNDLAGRSRRLRPSEDAAQGSAGSRICVVPELVFDDFLATWSISDRYPHRRTRELQKHKGGDFAQRLCDPVNGDLLQPPGDDRDLIAAARHGHVLAFDNMSGIKPDLGDSFCRLATGSEIGGRALYTNFDSATFKARRPLLVNGIGTLASRGDLADRSLIIKLSAIEQRISEKRILGEGRRTLRGALTGLLDALVLGLRQFEKTPTPNLRMADFAKLIVAAEPKLPWRRGAFLEAYATNQVNLNAALIEADEVAKRLLAFAEKHGSWHGLMSAVHAELCQDMSPEQRRAVGWPGNVRWFSDRVTRAAPALRAMGITVTSRHGKQGTSVTIGKIASPASPEPEMAEPERSDGDAKADAIPPGEAIASPPRSVASPSKPEKSANGDAGDASDAIFPVSGLAGDDHSFLHDLGGGQ